MLSFLLTLIRLFLGRLSRPDTHSAAAWFPGPAGNQTQDICRGHSAAAGGGDLPARFSVSVWGRLF